MIPDECLEIMAIYLSTNITALQRAWIDTCFKEAFLHSLCPTSQK